MPSSFSLPHLQRLLVRAPVNRNPKNPLSLETTLKIRLGNKQKKNGKTTFQKWLSILFSTNLRRYLIDNTVYYLLHVLLHLSSSNLHLFYQLYFVRIILHFRDNYFL